MQFEDHPTVRNLAKRVPDVPGRHPGVQDAALLRRIAVDHGADDVGIVDIGRSAIEPQRAEILRNYPWTKSLLSFVVRMAREPIRGAPRSIANLTNVVALYNFLSTFSGTDFLPPRTVVARFGYMFYG